MQVFSTDTELLMLCKLCSEIQRQSQESLPRQEFVMGVLLIGLDFDCLTFFPSITQEFPSPWTPMNTFRFSIQTKTDHPMAAESITGLG